MDNMVSQLLIAIVLARIEDVAPLLTNFSRRL